MEVLQLAATTSPPRIIYLMYMVAASLNKSSTFLWTGNIIGIHKKVELLFKKYFLSTYLIKVGIFNYMDKNKQNFCLNF